jgi:hypothetical protein
MNVKIGDRRESINFGWMEVISKPYKSGTQRKDMKVDVKFDNTQHIRKGVLSKSFLLGAVRDGSVPFVPVPGTLYKSNSDGYAELIEYKSSKEIVIRFVGMETGQYIQLDTLLTGLFMNIVTKDEKAKKAAKENAVREAAQYKQMLKKAARDEAARKVREEKEEKRRKRREKKQLALEKEAQRAAEIAEHTTKVFIPEAVETDLSRESKGVLNIDFKDRDGKWVLRFMMNGEFIQTRLGKLHNNMTQRCNKSGSLQNKHALSYKGTSVSEEFKDPQKFCDWVVQQPGWGLGYCLEKDVLLRGNREYSAEACVFLPAVINTAIIRSTPKKYTFIKFSKGKYHLNCDVGGKKILVTNIETKEAALQLYVTYKEKYLRKLAEEFKSTISVAAYDALLQWKFL